MTLPPCPPSPNCACSQATDPRHAVAPLAYEGPPEAAGEALLRALARLPRTEVAVAGRAPWHVRAVCTSRLFRFRDDVEIVQVPDRGVFDVRSASRVGWSDFGVNRRRVERLRALLREELAAAPGGPGPATPHARTRS